MIATWCWQVQCIEDVDETLFYLKDCWMDDVFYGDSLTSVVEAKKAEDTLAALKEEKKRLNQITQQVSKNGACFAISITLHVIVLQLVYDSAARCL